jgi:dTDP-glucose 4,6-dehydratase
MGLSTKIETSNSLSTSLVLGGAGFLGSHLCDRLLAEGHDVICMDNLLTGRRKNIQHLLGHPRFTFVLHDVTKPINLPFLMGSQVQKFRKSENGKLAIDYILHFASPASPKDYARHPIHTLKLGSLGTQYALGLARAHGSVFLLASTSEVYGDPKVSPQTETYWGHVNPVGPRSVYDEAKRFAEALTMAYHREHGIAVRIARIFNTYGDRMRIDDGRALPNFMAQALQGRPLTVYGSGRQTRSFCFVSDLVDGLYKLLLSDDTGPVNLGNPDEIELLKLAEIVLKSTRSPSRVVFEDLPEDDPTRRRPDIAKAKALLHWEPSVNLHDGIQRVIPYFRSQLAEAAEAGNESRRDSATLTMRSQDTA